MGWTSHLATGQAGFLTTLLSGIKEFLALSIKKCCLRSFSVRPGL